MNYEELLTWIKNKPYHSESQDPIHPYGFVIGFCDGKTFIMGHYSTVEKANEIAMTNFEPDKYIIIWSKYRNSSMVTRGIKHDKLEFGGDLREATRRVRHKEVET